MKKIDVIAAAIRDDIDKLKSEENAPGPIVTGFIYGLERALAIVEEVSHD